MSSPPPATTTPAPAVAATESPVEADSPPPTTTAAADAAAPADDDSAQYNAGVVEADDDSSSHASSSEYGTGASSSTTSVSSSIFSFTYENGRRYHSDRFNKAEYVLPNDEAEQDRLDLYHHIFLSLLGGKLYSAPLPEPPQRVLDLGTGTGIWAIDMADENPQAEVVGTDLSPIQPQWVPPNLKFEIDDMEDEWTFPENHFDFIHMRSLSGGIRDWDRLIEQIYAHVKPGGYFEFQDYGCELFTSDGIRQTGQDPRHPYGEFFGLLTSISAKFGRPLVIARTLKSRLEAAGFVDVTERKEVWPLGDWPKDKRLKEIGRYGKIGALESAEPFGLALLTRVEGWSTERAMATIKKAKRDLDSKSGGKYYCQGWFVVGRKPE